MDNILLVLILLLVGIIGGVLSTTTGLASLISYPSLLFLGLSPINANVTNTFALVFTGISSVISSRHELRGSWKEIFKILPIIIVGCILGTTLLFIFPEKIFSKVVPFCILFAAVVFLLPKHQGNIQNQHSSIMKLISWIGIFGVGIYSGYFGAAGGIVMLAILAIISSFPFIVYNAEKNFLLGMANVVSIIIYSQKIRIHWNYVLPLAFGFFVGGYIGPAIIRHVPEKIMKWVIGIGSIILAGYLFFQAWL